MDFSPHHRPGLGMLAWFIPATQLIGLFKSPWAKGEFLGHYCRTLS